jgi:hypothetical protein
MTHRRTTSLLALALGALLLLGAVAPPAGAATPQQDGAFVRAVHVDVLDRAPTPEQLADDTADLQIGYLRSNYLREYVFGLENLTQEVRELYERALDRAPDEVGEAHWVNTMGYTSFPLRETVARVMGSAEFADRIGHLDAETTVRQMFLRLLGHQPDQAGLDHWKAALVAHGGTYVARRLYESAEHRRQRTTQVFEEMLGRTPTPADRDFWAARIGSLGDLGLAIRLGITAEYDARAQARYGSSCDGPRAC